MMQIKKRTWKKKKLKPEFRKNQFINGKIIMILPHNLIRTVNPREPEPAKSEI